MVVSFKAKCDLLSIINIFPDAVLHLGTNVRKCRYDVVEIESFYMSECEILHIIACPNL